MPKSSSSRGDIEIYSELASAEHPEFGEGADDPARDETVKYRARPLPRQYPRSEGPASGSAAKPGSDAYMRTSGTRTRRVRRYFPSVKTKLSSGRGGKSFWVDLKLTAPPDVSREHCRIRRDPATGTFFPQGCQSVRDDHRRQEDPGQPGNTRRTKSRQEHRSADSGASRHRPGRFRFPELRSRK